MRIRFAFLAFAAVSVWGSDMGGSAPSCHIDAAHPVEQPAAKAEPANDGWPPQVQVPVTESESTDKNGEHVKTVLFKQIMIDKLYPSMKGPWARQYVALDPAHQSKHLWITKYRAEVLDGATGSASQEFMCHTNLAIVWAPGTPQVNQNISTQFSISQGEKEIAFPPGYALRIDDTPQQQLDVNVMVLNNNYPDLHKALDFKATIHYLDDATAQAKKLIPLFESGIETNCPTEPDPSTPNEPLCKTATAVMVHGGAGRRTGHWIVPPGRQEIHTRLGKGLNLPYDTTLHRIEMHVHPFAEWMQLRDITANKTIWKGRVRNDPKKAIVLSTEHYSDPKGIPIFLDHDYEVAAAYNNPTDHNVDAMASLWMYFRDKTL